MAKLTGSKLVAVVGGSILLVAAIALSAFRAPGATVEGYGGGFGIAGAHAGRRLA